MIRRPLIFFSLLVLALPGTAQNFVWDLGLVTRFDNREYKSALEASQTIFGARITPQIGIGWGNGNYVKVGANLMADFAAETFSGDELGLVYYGYERGNIRVFAGRFPRTLMRGEYNHAFFSDSLRFYDNALEGAMFRLDDGRHWFVEAGCDWNSHRDEFSREKFMLFAAGSYRLGMLGVGIDATMYHHAGSDRQAGVVDNLLASSWVEADLTRALSAFEVFSLKLSHLQALQNDRERVGKWVELNGGMVELRLQKAGLGVYNTLYVGDDLMPYWNRYGNGLYSGEAFFRTRERVYNRLEVYWRPFWKRRDVDLTLGSTHHYDGRKWSWQQVVELRVTLGEKMFRRR